MIRLKGIHVIIDDVGDGSPPVIQREYMTVQEDGVVRDVEIDKATRDIWIGDAREATQRTVSEAQAKAKANQERADAAEYQYEDLRAATEKLLGDHQKLAAAHADAQNRLDMQSKAGQALVESSERLRAELSELRKKYTALVAEVTSAKETVEN